MGKISMLLLICGVYNCLHLWWWQGRTHPVLVHYMDEPVQDYLRAAVSTAITIHKKEGPGDILVFLTGQDDVNAAVQLISEEAEKLPGALVALPLYAGLPPTDQVLLKFPSVCSYFRATPS